MSYTIEAIHENKQEPWCIIWNYCQFDLRDDVISSRQGCTAGNPILC